jgi:thiamine-monophosphate kinase
VDEFALIRRFFSRDTEAADVGVGDDGAVLTPDPGLQQVQVIDTLVEGVHFPANITAADVGYRAVAVNLSDVAAMGARPRFMTLALTLWDKDELWVEDFAAGLFAAADEHGVALIGGDTTQGDSVVVTVHVTADVEQGTALLRSGAQPGDTVFITGTVGDAAAGLQLLQNDQHDEFLVQRFLRPTARVATGRALRGKANAAIDLSDGLVADLTKLLAASGVGAEIDIEKVPLSAAIRNRFSESEQRRFALSGGDDYELCFTADADAVSEIEGITAIGRVVAEPGITCRHGGVVVEVDDVGYRHFA